MKPDPINRIKHHLGCQCGSRIIRRTEPAIGDKLLANATRVRVEIWKYDGEMELEYEIRGTLGSIVPSDDDGDTATVDDREMLDMAGSLLRAFAAGKRGDA